MKKSELFNKWRVNGTNFESHVNYNYYLGVITKVDFFFFFLLCMGELKSLLATLARDNVKNIDKEMKVNTSSGVMYAV